jgi:hypothetical protein
LAPNIIIGYDERKNPCDKSREKLKYNINKLEELGDQCEEWTWTSRVIPTLIVFLY